MKSIYLFAGELSGDLHGGSLAKAIKKTDPEWFLCGVAGPHMRDQGVIGSMQMEEFAVMGITDVLKNLPKLARLFFRVKGEILSFQPDAVILIDYPVFNIRLAKALRKSGYKGKIIHYICPSVWAHGKKRIQKMAKTLDLLLTIYPFEPKYFSKTGLKTTFVGNPVSESVQNYAYDKEWVAPKKPLIALFPGSRKGAVAANLKAQLEAASYFHEKHPEVSFAVSVGAKELSPLILPLIEASHLPITLVDPKHAYELMKSSTLALATSGTVTLELALHHCPTVVHYSLNPLNRFIAKYVMGLKLPYYCIVNIIGEKEIFPEWIEKRYTAKTLAEELEKLYAHPEPCIEECREITEKLGQVPASENAVKELKELFK
jgi:lipid-A-disaccharide synthase